MSSLLWVNRNGVVALVGDWGAVSLFFRVRKLLGTILCAFLIIYFAGFGLRIRVMDWPMVRVWVRMVSWSG